MVAAWIASMGVNPACTYNSISRCKAVARNRLIGAGDHRNSRPMQRSDDRQFLLVHFFTNLRTVGRWGHVGELFGEFGSDLVDARLKAGGRLGGGRGEKFHQRDGWIDHRVMLFQKRQRLLRLR